MTSPHISLLLIDLMGEATKKLYGTLADAGFDTLRRLGPL